MLRTLTKGAVATAAFAVGLLTPGGNAGAWAATGPGAGPSGTSVVSAPAPAGVSGTVAVVVPGSLTLSVPGGRSVSVIVTPSTVFAETGAVLAPSGVTVGEPVTVTPVTGMPPQVSTVTAADPGDRSRLVAQFVVVTDLPPVPVASGPAVTLIAGSVASVAAGSFVLDEAGGAVVTVETVETPSTTTYGESGSPTAPTQILAGQQVRVTPAAGPPSPASTLGAARVVIVLTQVTGTVQSVAATSFTLQLLGGLVVTVDSTGAQGFTADGSATAHVAPGQMVTAYGAADGSVPSPLDARFVHVDPALGSGCGGGSGDGDDGTGGGDSWGPPPGGHDGHDGSGPSWSGHGTTGGLWPHG